MPRCLHASLVCFVPAPAPFLRSLCPFVILHLTPNAKSAAVAALIPGLSEFFIFTDDDVLVSSPVTPDLFFPKALSSPMRTCVTLTCMQWGLWLCMTFVHMRTCVTLTFMLTLISQSLSQTLGPSPGPLQHAAPPTRSPTPTPTPPTATPTPTATPPSNPYVYLYPNSYPYLYPYP